MKTAKLVASLSDNTKVYECDPPMALFEPMRGDVPVNAALVISQYVALWCGAASNGIERAVIHAAERLAGGDGWGYGHGGIRIFDAKLGHQTTLSLIGYTISNEVSQA